MSCLAHFEDTDEALFLELGPGGVLSHLAIASGIDPDRVVLSATQPEPEASDDAGLAGAVAATWTAGVTFDWAAYFAGRAPRRVALPGYPFCREQAWLGSIENNVENSTSVPTPKQTPKQIAPNELHAAVTEIWQSLIGCDVIGEADNFFALGGDSMLLVRLQQALGRRLNLKLTLAELYQVPEFGDLIQCLTERLDSTHTAGQQIAPKATAFLADVDALMTRASEVHTER
ncbi:phosphopantetheine-binding protein [Yoonia sp. GPGPB17]